MPLCRIIQTKQWHLLAGARGHCPTCSLCSQRQLPGGGPAWYVVSCSPGLWVYITHKLLSVSSSQLQWWACSLPQNSVRRSNKFLLKVTTSNTRYCYCCRRGTGAGSLHHLWAGGSWGKVGTRVFRRPHRKMDGFHQRGIMLLGMSGSTYLQSSPGRGELVGLARPEIKSKSRASIP